MFHVIIKDLTKRLVSTLDLVKLDCHPKNLFVTQRIMMMWSRTFSILKRLQRTLCNKITQQAKIHNMIPFKIFHKIILQNCETQNRLQVWSKLFVYCWCAWILAPRTISQTIRLLLNLVWKKPFSIFGQNPETNLYVWCLNNHIFPAEFSYLWKHSLCFQTRILHSFSQWGPQQDPWISSIWTSVHQLPQDQARWKLWKRCHHS